MVLLDMEMPQNCVVCNNMGLRYFLECNLIFSGCANCGRHPNCPIKEEIPKDATNGDVIKAMFPNAEYKDRHNITIDKRNSENGELQRAWLIKIGGTRRIGEKNEIPDIRRNGKGCSTKSNGRFFV